jgi:hAT family C-terminal dimerisation region
LTWSKTDYQFNPVEPEDREGIKNGQIKGTTTRIGLVRKDLVHLEDMPKQLIIRLKKEFLNYYEIPRNDHLLALSCNPFTATVLIEDLESFHDVLKETSQKENEKKLLLDIKQRAKIVLKAAIEEMWGDKIDQFKNQANQKGSNSSDDNQDDGDGDMLAKARRKRFRASINPNMAQDPVSTCIDEFFAQRFQVHQVMSGQKEREENVLKKIGNNQNQWLENVELIASNFNVMEWWRNTGKNDFPLIYPVAMCILSLPDSNGHQERTFSAATWMDGTLNGRQYDLTFKMKVLMYKNEKFIERWGGKVGEGVLEDAKRRTKELIAKNISKKRLEEIESETEDLMEAYDIYEVEE